MLSLVIKEALEQAKRKWNLTTFLLSPHIERAVKTFGPVRKEALEEAESGTSLTFITARKL